MEQDTPVLTQKQQFFQVPKLQIWPLAKYIDKKKFGKWLDEIGVKYTKLKKVSGMDFGSVSFESPEIREQARKILNDVLLDGKPLRISDPSFKKRSTDETGEGNSRPNKKQKAKQEKPKAECIQDVVTPLWKMTYEQQIEFKTKNLKDILHKQLIKKLKQESKYDIPGWVTKKETSCVPIEEVKTSPEVTGYRNKCTFTIGYDKEKKPCVGFVFGKTEEDKHAVASPLECSNVSEKCKDIRNAFQDFITNTSKKSAYDKVTQLGFWRSIVVKTFSTGDVLVVVQIDTTDVNENDLNEEKEALIKYCQDKNLGIKSLSIQYNKGVSDISDEPCQLIMGEPYVYEYLNGLKFQISAGAFFQVNTSGAQVLYKLVTDWCDSIYDKITEFKELSLVFDVCCGTGTIGLTIAKILAKKVNKVIGIELSEDAIKDAKVNAELNEIKNINFICGKAEEALGKELRSFVNYAGIAIIDPPRAGLHPKTIKALRSCSFIKYIIFVSCDTRGLLDTTTGLCRSSSKTMAGEPFKPVKASAVDLFPGTETLEVVLLLER